MRLLKLFEEVDLLFFLSLLQLLLSILLSRVYLLRFCMTGLFLSYALKLFCSLYKKQTKHTHTILESFCNCHHALGAMI